MRDWSIPQRQSPAAILILIFKLLRGILKSILPILGGVFLARQGKLSKTLLILTIIIAATLLFSFIQSLLQYFYFRFYIEDGQLIIRKNIFSKKIIHIPLERIQSVNMEQKFWNTLTGTTRLIVDTPGTDQAEISLDALSLSDAHDLRNILIASKQEQPAAEPGEAMQEINTIKTSIPELIKFSLTANHLKTLGFILAFLLARLEDANQIFNDQAWDWLQTTGKSVDTSWKIITAIVVLALLISVIISIAGTVLRYFGLTVQWNHSAFNARWGLIQISQISIPFRKIQVAEWSSNFARRSLGIFLIKMKESATDPEKAQGAKKGEMKIPAFNTSQIRAILQCYQPDLPSGNSPAHQIHISYALRKIILLGIPLLLLSILSFLWIEWYAVIPVAATLYYIISTLIYRKKFRFWVSEGGLQFYRSVWGENHQLVNWEKIQSVTMSRSYYQRRKDLASIHFLTAGGKIKLPYISRENAEFLLNYSLFKLESENKNWM